MKRIEGLAKLTGAERYVDDLPADAGLGLGPCLWGMTVRSPAARGRVKEVRYGKGVDWSKLVVVDHRDCGAFKVAFGKDYKADAAGETQQHKTVMEQVKAKLAKTHPDLVPEFYLMALDGKVERVV